MRVLKFGGTSVGSADAIARVCSIVDRAAPCAVVVSALGGVTDLLLELAHDAARGGSMDEAKLRALTERHHDLAREVTAPSETDALLTAVDAELSSMADVARGIALVGEASARSLDRVVATGELCSSKIVAAALRKHGVEAQALDAREVLRTDASYGAARCDEAASFPNIRAWFEGKSGSTVITGFIAREPGGDTTTLGRSGSDTSAALFAAALGAEALEIWTDVPGVMSADPRVVPDAVALSRMSYEELMELSHFGAKVVHPPTVHPARAHRIPLWIKNSFDPGAEGTLVLNEGAEDAPRPGPVCGITSIRDVALLSLEGDGMVGVPGIAGRLFASLARHGVNVMLISQASSEHTICFAVRPDDVNGAKRAVATEFAAEQAAGMVRELVVEPDQTILAVVGAGMRHRPGISGRIFDVLGRDGVNVRAIAQGSSELNVSLVVARDDEIRGVRTLHRAFFRDEDAPAHVAVAGVGGVGSQLLEQLAAHGDARGLRLVAACNSSHMAYDAGGLDPSAVRGQLVDSRGLDGMVETLCASNARRRVFVDVTASDATGAHYEALLRAGVHVVAANKRRFAGAWSEFATLRDAGPGRAYFETTVGAGLPVIQSLRALVASGDRVRRIDGVLSGTASALLADLEAGRTMSEAIRSAHERGFTEPDPREDLGGMDVARKLLILARVAGLPLEPDDVEVEPLLAGDEWATLSLDEFWERVGEIDAAYAERHEKAANEDKRLRYLARIEDGRASVGLVAVDSDHACWDMRSGQNLVAFTTERYAEDPLVIRGPGAGQAVTAAGVFADILQAIDQDRGDG